eukprot:s262_g1.t1
MFPVEGSSVVLSDKCICGSPRFLAASRACDAANRQKPFPLGLSSFDSASEFMGMEFAGCIASLGWQADWRSGSAWYALLYSELFVLALILAWLQKALHLLSGMPRAEAFATWRVHQAMGIASLGLRDPGLVLVSWLVLSALTEAAGSAIDSFVKETDRKHAGEELIRSPRPSELKASARTAVRFSVALEKELEAGKLANSLRRAFQTYSLANLRSQSIQSMHSRLGPRISSSRLSVVSCLGRATCRSFGQDCKQRWMMFKKFLSVGGIGLMPRSLVLVTVVFSKGQTFSTHLSLAFSQRKHRPWIRSNDFCCAQATEPWPSLDMTRRGIMQSLVEHMHRCKILQGLVQLVVQPGARPDQRIYRYWGRCSFGCKSYIVLAGSSRAQYDDRHCVFIFADSSLSSIGAAAASSCFRSCISPAHPGVCRNHSNPLCVYFFHMAAATTAVDCRCVAIEWRLAFVGADP